MADRHPTSRRRGHPPTAILALAILAAACGPPAPPASLEPSLHTVDSDGHPMAVWEKSGEPAQAVVLLLHGRTWSTLPDFDLQVAGEELSLMDGLVDRGFGVYGMDARGYGQTPRDDTGWLTPDRAAADVVNVLTWLRARHQGRPVHLFGWSYGSMVAQLTVQRRADLVASVVLFGYPTDPDRTYAPRDYPGEPPRLATTAEAAASDFIVEGSISAAAVAAFVQAALVADPIRVDWRADEQWAALDPDSVRVPTLLMQGEFDPLTPTEAQARLFTRLATPDREWVVVPGGDHAAFLETPRAYFLDALAGFLTRSR